MPIVPLDTLEDPRVADYHALRDQDLLRNRRLFVAEGRLVVDRIVQDPRYRVVSVLVSETACRALEATWSAATDVPVYVGRAHDFRNLAGLNVHRGCLALVERPPALAADALVAHARTLLVLDRVANPDNVGGVFRNAAAFGVDAVLLTRACCDPLYRKSIRTSMGAALGVPFARVDGWSDLRDRLRARGCLTVALTPDASAQPLATLAAESRPEHLALLLGAEGDGLSADALAIADRRGRIPIHKAVDSLNVAVAAGIALAMLTSKP